MLKTLQKIRRVGCVSEPPPAASAAAAAREREALQGRILEILGRALCIRVVDAGSCNACELEINALGNPIYNIEGLGVRFVASPRHADLLLVTGPVTRNMREALLRTYEATPDPKLVVAVGDCAATGGVFGESGESLGRISNVIPVDATIAGCPPSPTRLLAGLLTVIEAARGA
ncbi:MAG: formate hydrogenlyase [Gammaproteobacteria bacterium]|nr:formate hydrogenlyase [Gammaproteobacteria bacterium]